MIDFTSDPFYSNPYEDDYDYDYELEEMMEDLEDEELANCAISAGDDESLSLKELIRRQSQMWKSKLEKVLS